MDFLPKLWPESSSGTFIAASSAVATVALLSFFRWSLYPVHPKVIPSPLKTVIPKLSPEQLAKLEYAPDAFPGARDVETPYGSIRTYEFGPLDGRKVLLVHGISTSCQTLTPIAHALVARGRRVLLFDLFGRGFSDGVGDLPHDARLYTTQMLLALAASPLPWTGDGALDLVGYSMGGGVAVHFAAAFPRLVRSLVLLAPAGLIRPERFGRLTRFVFASGAVPERLLAAITRRRLRSPIARSARGQKAKLQDAVVPKANPVELLAAEVPAAHSALTDRVGAYVRWMLAHHAGFVPAFMACVRGAPLMEQHGAWAALAGRAAGSVCLVLGAADEIIDAEAMAEDALPLLGGEGRVRWAVVEGGGHDFPMTHAGETVEVMDGFWG